ncbi:hypothetical protein A3C87_03140 [Candidatus Kaiserbacteria bacterium RIFCSPHIGHO2_02_FULL_49_34]|uniref:Endonuclease/exonuclease/phosphatase domain-containing protein n=1 Tax=Candidatus Kaiserbacteria bacterium RIFCSPHIGHO2_02_FULL_49_34 TaxID=1798491 RepID=A0A1F6DIG9_9BACT|nr:MAG: hypothetical protein A3C87_03140 [Candidatus Kaiserbacteria bacterium RIFCSPHIGHO2_02_FULL_49_34]
MSIRVVSLNIEGRRHLERFPAYVRTLRPEIVLLQEVPFEERFRIGELLGLQLVDFIPMARSNGLIACDVWGLGCYVSAAVDAVAVVHAYYAQFPGTPICNAPEYQVNRILQDIVLRHNNLMYKILHTHFTWTPNGLADAQQLEHYAVFQRLLAQQDSFVLFGDLNAPRGMNLVWADLAACYVDNIPQEAATTLDPVLHRVGHLPRIVDACFTHGKYTAHKVTLHAGLSDHQAVCADICA